MYALSRPVSPFHSGLPTLFRELDRALGLAPLLPTRVSGLAATALPVQVTELSDHYRIRADVPGARLEDVRVTVEDGILTIGYRRPTESVDGPSGSTGRVLYADRIPVEGRRTIELPEALADDGQVARLVNGVLDLTLPKAAAPARQAREIPIQ